MATQILQFNDMRLKNKFIIPMAKYFLGKNIFYSLDKGEIKDEKF